MNNDLLSPASKEADPSEHLSPDVIVEKLEKKSLVWYLVECLSKVEQNSARLNSLIKLCSQVINRQDQLGLTRLSFTEAVSANVALGYMGGDCGAFGMLEELPAKRCQDGGRGDTITFLENWLHMGMSPCRGYLARPD